MATTVDPDRFKALVSDEELSQVPRDLRFHPVVNPRSRVLTTEQIAHFNREGYISGLRAWDAVEAGRIRAGFERIQACERAAGRSATFIRFSHLRYGFAWDILTDARIVAVVRDLLGEDIAGWGTAFFCKEPGDGSTVAWHQDASYWPLTPSKAVTVWLAIDDVDQGNAAMKFIAGSHHHGQHTYRQSTPEEHNALTQTVEHPEQFGHVVHNCLRAGEFSIHNDLLLHGSEANVSTRRRCGLTLRYAPVDVRAHLGWHERAVWVSGRDPSGHWGNQPRPAGDFGT